MPRPKINHFIPAKHYCDLYYELVNKAPDQGHLLKQVKKLPGFKFLSSRYVQEILGIPLDKEQQTFQYISRVLERGEVDPDFLIGIKYMGLVKAEYITCFLFGKFLFSTPLPSPTKRSYNVKIKHVGRKFPDALSYPQRKEWRREHAKLLKNPTYVPSSFYTTWAPRIHQMNSNWDHRVK